MGNGLGSGPRHAGPVQSDFVRVNLHFEIALNLGAQSIFFSLGGEAFALMARAGTVSLILEVFGSFFARQFVGHAAPPFAGKRDSRLRSVR
jgi:hypothetical protein